MNKIGFKKFALDIDSGANFIIEELENNGYEGYVVGGCVRDIIMGRSPNDWDITTDAKPEEVMEIFDRTIPTGMQHGTITVLVGDESYEVTTYRIDGEYVDMRRPENVEFSKNIVDDLSRRDFTINAMAYNKRNGLIDEFGGIEDIKRKIIKCVGEPDKRFNEDALRMIRAIRFSAKLGFNIDKETYLSMERNSSNIKKISMERINKEIEETIKYDCEKLSLLNDINISSWIFGDVLEEEKLCKAESIRCFLDKYDLYDEDEEDMINTLKRVFIFENREVGEVKSALKRLRYSRKDVEKTFKLSNILRIYNYGLVTDENLTEQEKRVRIKYLLKDTNDIVLAKYAIYLKFIEKNTNPTVCFSIFNDIIDSGECFSVSQLDLNGKDIIENNVAKGAAVGIILNALLEYVIIHPEENEKEKLLAFAKNYKIV